MPLVSDLSPDQHKRLAAGLPIWSGKIISLEFSNDELREAHEKLIEEWLIENATGRWLVVYNMHRMIILRLEEENDVIMFKLRFAQ